MHYFQYGETEIEYLKRQDVKMAAAIDRIGLIKREITPALFEALVSSIISQQISKKAAQTVWNRFRTLIPDVSPENLLRVSVEAIQQCGMSLRKAGYIRGIAEAAQNGDIDFEVLPGLSDREIIQRLSSLRGVGVWTAEMLLIFSLNRPDVFSFNDLAIRRGLMNLHGLETLSRTQFEGFRALYSPFCSAASLYLWELSGGV